MLVPPPQAPHDITNSNPAPSSQAARRLLILASAIMPASHNNAYSQNTPRNPVMPGGRNLPCGGASDGAVVEIATATVGDVLPFTVIELGASVQVDSEGAPVHVKSTVWLNPPSGTRVKE